MPYVPSRKTDGQSNDREVIDAAVENLAQEVAEEITDNVSLRNKYQATFLRVSNALSHLLGGEPRWLNQYDVWGNPTDAEFKLAQAIFEVGAKYNYGGAYLGEFNYAWTKFIQQVPKIKVRGGSWQEEFRYWVYAETVSALIFASNRTICLDIGVDGVFEDIKDEYKRRVNTAYEAAQILKSGDCYSGPYYTRLIEVVDEEGRHVGHQEVMLKRGPETAHSDILNYKIVVKRNS